MTAHKKHIPVLRFKGFQDQWEIMRLDEVTEKIQDGTHFSPVQKEHGKYKYITSKNIRNGFMDLNDVLFVEDETHKEIYKRCDVKFNDILLTKDGASTGTVCLNELHEEFSLLSSVAFLRADKSLATNEFIYQYLAGPQGQREIKASIAGQAITRITLSKISNYKFSFPTLPEQQKIASYLTAIDEKIKQLMRKKALLEEYKKGVLHQLFSGKLRFKDENGKGYPKWVERRLGDVAEIIGGGTPDTLIPEYWDGNIQWYTPTEISGIFASKSKRTISNLGLEKSSAKLLPAGTILFTSRATIAELSFATEECTTNQGFQSLIVNQTHDSKFIFYWIKNNKKAFIRKSQGSTFLEISKTAMEKIRILSPVLAEQRRIGTYLSAIDTKIETVATQIAKTQEFKKGLLQKMFV